MDFAYALKIRTSEPISQMLVVIGADRTGLPLAILLVVLVGLIAFCGCYKTLVDQFHETRSKYFKSIFQSRCNI